MRSKAADMQLFSKYTSDQLEADQKDQSRAGFGLNLCGRAQELVEGNHPEDNDLAPFSTLDAFRDLVGLQ